MKRLVTAFPLKNHRKIHIYSSRPIWRETEVQEGMLRGFHGQENPKGCLLKPVSRGEQGMEPGR